MALSNKQKQAEYKARKVEQGLSELRGVWVNDNEKAALKAVYSTMLKNRSGIWT